MCAGDARDKVCIKPGRAHQAAEISAHRAGAENKNFHNQHFSRLAALA